MIDPRVCGNQGQYANHSCTPNARLVEIDVRGKNLVFLAALRQLKAGEESYFGYGWYTGRLGSKHRIPCFCGSDNCRLAI